MAEMNGKVDEVRAYVTPKIESYTGYWSVTLYQMGYTLITIRIKISVHRSEPCHCN